MLTSFVLLFVCRRITTGESLRTPLNALLRFLIKLDSDPERSLPNPEGTSFRCFRLISGECLKNVLVTVGLDGLELDSREMEGLGIEELGMLRFEWLCESSRHMLYVCCLFLLSCNGDLLRKDIIHRSGKFESDFSF